MTRSSAADVRRGPARIVSASMGLILAVVLVSCGDAEDGRPSVDPTLSPTATSSRTGLPSPTRTPIRSDSPAETETAQEPSRPERTSRTPRPTVTRTATADDAPGESTGEALEETIGEPTEETTGAPTDENTGEGTDEDAENVPTSVWWLLAALVVALAVGIPLLVRSRRRKAWTTELAAAEQEVAWLARDLLPELQRSGSREQAVGGWAVSSERVRALEDRLTSLEATAPSDSGRERARTLRDAVRAARGRVDALSASATDQTASAEVGSVASALSSALGPVGTESTRV